MKKKIFKFLIFIIFLVPAIAFAHSCARRNPEGTRVTCDGDGCFDGFGLEINLLMYDGHSSERTVGHPILIYTGNLFGTKTYYYGSGGKNPNYWDFVASDSFESLVPEPKQNGESDVFDSTCTFYDKLRFDQFKERKAHAIEGGAGYMEYMYIATGNGIITTFPGSMLDTSRYQGKIFSVNLSYDENAITTYLNSAIKEYAGSVSKINSNFGVNIDYSKIEQYYLKVELVKRYVSNKRANKTGEFVEKVSSSNGVASGDNAQIDERDAETIPASLWKPWYDANAEICGTYSCNCKDNYKTVNTSSSKVCENKGGIWNGNGKCKIFTKRTCDKCAKTCEVGKQISLSDYHGTEYTGQVFTWQIWGTKYNGTSSLNVTATSNLKDYYGSNSHCILNEKDECTNQYQYYIGPNLEEALVGTANNPWKLINENGQSTGSGKPATSIKHYYLPDILSCKNVCELASSNKSSDTYLSCAENYCDANIDFNLKGNTVKRKRSCLLGECGYTYGKSPTDGTTTNKDRESVNSCNNSNPYNGIVNANVRVDTTSACSIDKLTGDDLSKTNAMITSCVGDQVTDFDGNDENDTIFDHRTYINVACKETSNFGFTDLSNKRLVAGQGIDYHANLNGEKECTIYFNLELWKVDYASVSSKDPERRKRLLFIYNTFNNALDDTYDVKKDSNYDEQWKDDGKINWNDNMYDISKVSVVSEVSEIINNVLPSIKSGKYTLVVNRKDDDSNATIVGKENIKRIEFSTINNLVVNRYVQTNKVNVTYTFDKYCVTNDGKANIYKAPSSGICYTTGSGNNSFSVFGKNVYYTNLNATRNADFSNQIIKANEGHGIKTDVSIGIDTKNSNSYYADGESCPYKIDDANFACSIVVKSLDGTIMHGNDIYVYGDVNASIVFKEMLGLDEKIESFGITKGSVADLNNNDNITVSIGDKKNGVEKIQITGIISSNKGRSTTCNRTIYIINPSDKCGVSCSVEKVNNSDLLYEIKSPETGNKTQTQKPSAYYTALSTNMDWKVVLPDIKTGKRLVRLDKKIGNIFDNTGLNILEYNDTIVYGKVKGTMMDTGEACYNVCWSDPPELPNCETSYKPTQTAEINNHCANYWNVDVNNYKGYDECTYQCSEARMCGSDRRNYTEVETVCKNNYITWGFKNASGCVNYCYYCPECESGYIFRPVNNYNPFPNSSDSNTLGYNYATGNRIIGSNWIGKSEYIKKDDKDSSSVTGVNANQKVEYVIELTPSVIKQIRNDTDSYNKASGGNDAYLDYVYMEGTDTTKRYYSKFINETFKDYFTVIDGESK